LKKFFRHRILILQMGNTHGAFKIISLKIRSAPRLAKYCLNLSRRRQVCQLFAWNYGDAHSFLLDAMNWKRPLSAVLLARKTKSGFASASGLQLFGIKQTLPLNGITSSR
jgi:hypothetical protein